MAWAICGPARPLAAALPPSPEAEARALVVRSALEEVASGNAGDCGEWETAFLLVEATDCGGLCRTAAGAAPRALPELCIGLERQGYPAAGIFPRLVFLAPCEACFSKRWRFSDG